MMKNLINRDLLNEIVTGALIAATFAAVVPCDALAVDLAGTAIAASSTIAAPAVKFVSYISYTLGTVMTVAGIANAKKHADNPASAPLGPAVGKLGAGAAFLAAPSMVSMLQQTTQSTAGSNTGTFQAITGF